TNHLAREGESTKRGSSRSWRTSAAGGGGAEKKVRNTSGAAPERVPPTHRSLRNEHGLRRKGWNRVSAFRDERRFWRKVDQNETRLPKGDRVVAGADSGVAIRRRDRGGPNDSATALGKGHGQNLAVHADPADHRDRRLGHDPVQSHQASR